LPSTRRFPPVRVMGRRRRLAPAVPPGPHALRRADRGPDEDRIPLTESLQPTCYQRAPLVPTYSRARGSHRVDRSFGTQPSPNTLVLSSDCVLRIGAGWPEGISDPEWRRNWRRVRQPWHFVRAPFGGARVVLTSPGMMARGRLPFLGERRQPARRCCLPMRGSDDEATDASCRDPPPKLAGWRAGSETPRAVSTGSTPMLPLPRPEAPSTDGSLSPRPLLALRTRLPGRHWSLGFAAAVQLPTRLRSYRYELGLAPEPVIHRSWQGHVPPIDFCSVWTPEHDHRCPDPPALNATVEPPRGG
jgi:hypothetical protein